MRSAKVAASLLSQASRGLAGAALRGDAPLALQAAAGATVFAGNAANGQWLEQQQQLHTSSSRHAGDDAPSTSGRSDSEDGGGSVAAANSCLAPTLSSSSSSRTGRLDSSTTSSSSRFSLINSTPSSSTPGAITAAAAAVGVTPLFGATRGFHSSPAAARAVHAQRVADDPTAAAPEPPAPEDPAAASSTAADVNPFAVVSDEVNAVSERLRHSVVSSVPALKAAADYYFRPGVEGKRLRPTLVLLLSGALTGAAPAPSGGGSWGTPDLRPPSEIVTEPRRRAQRMAEIAELIHVASLLHDDVIDDASTRRGVLSLNASAGNKLAILAGDFLLARASVTIASLRNHEVTALMSQVLEDLVAGEVMQMTAPSEALGSLDHYLEKTFCKTASLMANSARCAALIAGAPAEAADAAWQYGRHLGLAFQIVDDILDITASASVLGKPALNDMRAGLATAPVLLAAREQPGLLPLIERKFKGRGDVSAAVEMVHAGRGVEAAQALAAEHATAAGARARALLAPGADAHAQLCSDALVAVTRRVLTRKK